MKIVLFLLLSLLSLELGATGIGPPAGMGALLIIMAVVSILAVLLISWVAWKLYKKSGNKKRYLFWRAYPLSLDTSEPKNEALSKASGLMSPR